MKRPAACLNDDLPVGISSMGSGFTVRRSGSYIGWYPDIGTAREQLSDHLQCRVRDLPIRGSARPDSAWEPTEYTYISSRHGRYRVRVGEKYCGTFDSLKLAFEALMHEDLVPVPKADPGREIAVFKLVYPMFHDWMPVDWHTLLQMDKMLQGLVVSRCIYMFMVWGKETEFRMHLAKQMPRANSTKQSSQLLAASLVTHGDFKARPRNPGPQSSSNPMKMSFLA